MSQKEARDILRNADKKISVTSDFSTLDVSLYSLYKTTVSDPNFIFNKNKIAWAIHFIFDSQDDPSRE